NPAPVDSVPMLGQGVNCRFAVPGLVPDRPYVIMPDSVDGLELGLVGPCRWGRNDLPRRAIPVERQGRDLWRARGLAHGPHVVCSDGIDVEQRGPRGARVRTRHD